MDSTFCKRRNTYQHECKCEDTAKCPAYWKQGIGSLIDNGVSNVNNVSESRNISNSRE
jgi:hypothetical protein